MRSLLVLSIALCLGLATAAPATDLIKALLKRAEAEQAMAKPEKPEDGGMEIIPTEKEFMALAYLGYGVEWLVNKAADPEAFIAYMDAEAAKDGEVAAEKRGRGGNGGRGRKGRSGEDKPKGQKDWEGDFEKSIMEVGVYKTVLKHVGVMATMLKHSGAIFAHMSGPDCKDCPELPEEVEAILLGEAEEKAAERRQVDSVSSEELDGADSYPMMGKRPQGGMRPKSGEEGVERPERPEGMERPEGGKKGGPRGGPRGKMGGKGQKPASGEVDAAFGQEAVSELAKRLLKMLARK